MVFDLTDFFLLSSLGGTVTKQATTAPTKEEAHVIIITDSAPPYNSFNGPLVNSATVCDNSRE